MTDRPAASAPSPARRPADRLRLSPRHRAQLVALLREHLPGVEVWAYGSRITGESHDGSDLDLVLRAPGLQKIPVGRLSDLWEALRESTIPFLVEARDWARLPEGFHGEIERDYVVLVKETKQHDDNEWLTTTLGDVITLKRGYDLSRHERVDGPVPVVSSSGIIDYHSDSKVSGPGVVTGRYGTLGQVFFIPNDFWPLNTALYVQDFKGNDPRFIAYFLRTLDFSAYSDKAAVPGLNRNHLHQESVHIPTSVSEQRAIAHILGALDDKIELNRRMNETLEAMARALFQSWFVDFDPVRARMEKRDTGLPRDVADLFSDRLVDSDLDLIPEGWTNGHLSDIAVSPRKGVNPEDLSSATPYIGLEHMPHHSIALAEWETAAKVTSNKSTFDRGDILFGKLRPYFHKVGIAPVSGICSTDIMVIAPKVLAWYGFLLEVVSSKNFVDYADQTSTGTRMPRSNWRTMSNYKVTLPPPELAASYHALTKPSFDRIMTNIHESQLLLSMRDSLLPKLVSGTLRLGGLTCKSGF